MTKQEDNAVITDLEVLVDKSVDNRLRPVLIMSGCTEERIIKRIDRLEDLVIRKRLFYRKVVFGCAVFIALILLSG